LFNSFAVPPHGEYNGSFVPEHPHWDFHVHSASTEMIGTGQRPEKRAVASREFASYEEALQYFLRTTNVTDASAHFAEIAQGLLPFAEEDSNA
jgi:hypothetical protein